MYKSLIDKDLLENHKQSLLKRRNLLNDTIINGFRFKRINHQNNILYYSSEHNLIVDNLNIDVRLLTEADMSIMMKKLKDLRDAMQELINSEYKRSKERRIQTQPSYGVMFQKLYDRGPSSVHFQSRVIFEGFDVIKIVELESESHQFNLTNGFYIKTERRSIGRDDPYVFKSIFRSHRLLIGDLNSAVQEHDREMVMLDKLIEHYNSMIKDLS